ncbi:conserved hypothetical protein [Leishmania mexicana MHOM/GT/2001/U1103]|uniref:Uncharacterized protein n=1 Tax=Leishmania mexicana (strain MHOM/GT/2001/U1103) TaxID=929439 RepID=E9B112_LEIMU|nr:conserved hypothetical protein [Leishmania mexicana MHOM/GT/2001/U1103]CBZ28917.1 conserved hypothetical protein [Leishmania mexicana MHOM/GT/2001/U1103]
MTLSITPVALPSSALLNPKEAAVFYESACRSEGVFIQSTFLKQLLLGSVIIQFENGYLGESGVGPIIRTLQCAPLRALLLAKCALSTEDMKTVCAGLAQHPQLEKIDIRGVPLTIGGAKELLHLVTHNTHITEVLMDESLPKYVAIQRQCNRNAQATYQINECMICGAAVSSKAGTSCETLVTRLLLEYWMPASESVSVAGLRVLCGAWQECLNRNKGILAVCAGLCAESLAEDLCRCVSSVTKALVMQMPYDAPNLVFLRSYLTREHRLLQAEAEAEQTQQPEPGSAPSRSLLVPGPVDAAVEERWRTKRARTDIDAFFQDDSPLCLPRCTVCGCLAECSQDGPTWLLRVLQKDITEHGAVVTPVALVRLWRLFGVYANLQPCSRRCVRHLVRYGLYGYGGVNCSYASGYPPLSSAVGGSAELQRLPLVNFSVVDVEREVVEDVCGGELNCALTVASALGDEEGAPMDPYLLFAIGRQLRQQSVRTIGMDLASACEAARLVGCLPVSEAPFQYRGRNNTAEAPPRDLVADWATWSSSSGEATVRKWLHRAFAHRRQRVCVVDGPHRDLFDNIRAALWTLRRQARSILVTVKFAVAWLSLPNGVIPPDTSVHKHGFYTTAKVIGQSTLHNTVYIILQFPFGIHVGYKGFFYLPKTVFLQIVRGLAFVFLDAVGIEYRSAGGAACVYGYELVGRPVGATSPDALALLRRLLMCSMVLGLEERQVAATVWRAALGSCDVKEMRRLLSHEHLPAPLEFLRSFLEARQVVKAASDLSDCRLDIERRRQCHANAPRTYWERVLLCSRFPSQLLFFFSELIGTQESFDWLQEALRAASAPLTTARGGGTSDQATLSFNTAKHGADLMSHPPTATTERQWIVTLTAPSQVVTTVRFPECSLRLDSTPVGATARRSPSASQQRRSVKLEQTVSMAPKHASAKTPKPPSALPLSGRRGKTLRQSSVASSAPKGPLRAKSAESQASEEGMSTASATSTAFRTESRSSFPFDKNPLLRQLHRRWAEERAKRKENLQAASSVGMLEFLRALQRPSSAVKQLRRGSHSASQTVHADDMPALDASNYAHAPAAIPGRLLGKPWLVVPFPESTGNSNNTATSSSSSVSDTLLLFIGDTVSAYNQRESRFLCGPVTMCDDPLLVDFPFRTGVDAAVAHPTEPHLAFFFSGREWLLFDFYLAECVDGPYATSSHGQFRRLPSIFHDRLDGVVQVPHTQLLVFFRDYCYVVFDTCTRRCVGGMGFLNPPSREAVGAGGPPVLAGHTSSSMPPALEDLIRTLQQTTAASQSVKSAQVRRDKSNDVDSDADDDAVQAMAGPSDTDTTALPLMLSTQLQGLLMTAPMTAFCVRSADSGKNSEACYVVSRTGAVIPVCWQPLEDVSAAAETQESGVGVRQEPQRRWLLKVQEQASPTAATPLRNLPLLFRQFTTAALADLCKLAVETECTFAQPCAVSAASSSQLCVFDPERQAQTRNISPLAAVNPPDAGREGDSVTANTSSGTPCSKGGRCGKPLPTSALVRVTSSLIATGLGERVPLALSRCWSAQETDVESTENSTWHDEVLFYGDAEEPHRPRASEIADSLAAEGQLSPPPLEQEASGCATEVDGRQRVSFIEYDLGASAPQRIFTALLLVLDTSALPSSLLQLSSLVASVDSSNDGKMYFSQALVRITSPVVAARWGSGAGSVTSSAARFWRLRFRTPVPACLGVVRLFWMETAPGSFAETQLPAPTVLSPCMPVTLTVPPRRRELTASDGDVADVQPSSRDGRAATGDPLIIEAEELFQASRGLLSNDNFHPVFADDPSRSGAGWFVPHAVMPELVSSSISTCVFVCASSILQLGWAHQGAGIAATQAEAQPMVRRTGFRDIPYPFVLGWDAVFYVAPREHPGRVALLRGDWMLLWDLHEQRPLSDVLLWRTSALLDKLGSLPIAAVIAVINCWSSEEGDAVIGIFHVASSLEEREVKYVEFDLKTGVVLDLPVLLAACLMDRFHAPPPPPGSTLHTVLCTPCSPSTWYMFWDRSVQTVSRTELMAENGDGSDDGAASAIPLSESRLFYSVPLYLSEWGQPQHHCSVLLDVPRLLNAVQGESGDGLLITGMQLYSAGGRGGERTCWQVQCSENGGGEWRDMAMHYQAGGGRACGETLWTPSDACALSNYPYWRLSRVTASQDPNGAFAAIPSFVALETAVAQSYSQLRLLTVPRRRCRRLPTHISGDAATTPVADINSFFSQRAPGAVTLSLQPCASASAIPLSALSDGVMYELMWDYGSSPVALCSVAFEPRDTSPFTVQCTWTMWHSSTAVGPGICCATTTKLIPGSDTCGRCTLSWLPDGPYRYWRLQCEWRAVAGAVYGDRPPASLTISSFSAHEYDGPLITVYNASGGCLRATPLLWPMADGATTSPYQLQCVANSVIQLMNVPLGLTFWETEFVGERGGCMARIAVESTNDAREWSIAAETTIHTGVASASRPQLCSLSWPSCGAHVLWRLRVLESSADVTLHLTHVRLGHCPTASHISMFVPQHTASNPICAATAAATAGALRRSLSITAVVEAPVEDAPVSMLRLTRPQRMVRVRATLPSSAARYHVEYLGPDGTSWLFAGVMDSGRADARHSAYSSNRSSAVVGSVTWDGTLVSPSTHWRLRPVDETSLDQPQGVEWFEHSSEYSELVDTAEIPGVVVSTTGFTEVQFPSILSGSAAHSRTRDASTARIAPPMPVLQCTAQSLQGADTAHDSTPTAVTWSFLSPAMFDQVLLFVHSTVDEPVTPTVVETPREESSASASADAEAPPPPAPQVSANQPLRQVLVETSDNGQDYVAVAETVLRLCDQTVSLRWVEVPTAAFWRLRFAPYVAPPAALPEEAPLPVEESSTFTLSLYAARWLIRRGGHALLAQATKPTPGHYTNTIFRSWISDAFNREGVFMQSCLHAFEEFKGTQNQRPQKNTMSRLGKVAGTVQKMKQMYQAFLQKAAKEAGSHMQLGGEDAAQEADGRSSRAVAPLFPPSVPAEVSEWLSKKHLSSDIIYLLVASTTATSIGGPHVLHLAELVHHPLAFRQALQFTKRTTSWFYPCLEAVGSLAEDWYGFPASRVCASLSVFWSLSTLLQRQLDALLSTADTITALNEHVASPLVVVSITESNWVPFHHFPTVAPFLYAVGFHERSFTMAFAINDIVFTPPYAMGVPSARDSQPLLSPYPYMIAAGVNFVQQCPLGCCPAPVMDVLRYILPASAFAMDARGNAIVLTTLVLTVGSLRAGSGVGGEECSAVLRFTVSGNGVNFGLTGLVMESIEFEVLMLSADGVSADRHAPAGQRFHQMNFVSHGARFAGGAGALAGLPAAQGEDDVSGPEMELPLSLMGAVDSDGLPLVSLRGDFGNARFATVAELPGAVVTHLRFTTICHVEGSVPVGDASSTGDGGGDNNVAHWVFAPLEGEGQVLLPGVLCSCNCGCRVDTTCGKSKWPVRLSSFHIAVDRCSVEDLEAVFRACRGDERDLGQELFLPARRDATAYDVGGLRVEVAASLRLLTGHVVDDRVLMSLKGMAILSLENTAIPDATLEMDCEAGVIALTARCVHSLVVGATLFEGCSEKPILIQLLRPVGVSRSMGEKTDQGSAPASALRFLVCGYGRLFGVHHMAHVTLELSQSTERFNSVTLVAASLRHAGLVVTLQDCAVSEVWRFAQTTMNEHALRGIIERDMGGVPIIAAMKAHQIPLALSIASIVPEPYDIVAQRLSCRVKGLLYGASFDVVTSVVAPDDSEDLWSLLGAQCIPAILEQCEANLWASYANIVGLRETRSGCPLDTNAAV